MNYPTLKKHFLHLLVRRICLGLLRIPQIQEHLSFPVKVSKKCWPACNWIWQISQRGGIYRDTIQFLLNRVHHSYQVKTWLLGPNDLRNQFLDAHYQQDI